HPSLRDEPREVGLMMDLDAVRVVRTRERGRVHTVVDERDLRGGERDDLGLGVVAIDGIEVVEVAAGGSHDQDATGHGGPFREDVMRGWLRRPALRRGMYPSRRITAAITRGRRDPRGDPRPGAWPDPDRGRSTWPRRSRRV